MSALTVFYLILPFPIAFILHDAEEVVLQHRWMVSHVLVGGVYAMQIWSALFMAFSIHLLVHIGQAIVMRGYVPGLVSTILLLPYAFVAIQSIWYAMSGMELVVWGIIGVFIMVVNLRFAHWLGMIMK